MKTLIEKIPSSDRHHAALGITSFSLVASLFFIPLSSTFKSIFIVLSLISILLNPLYRPDLKEVIKTHWARACVLFFALVVLGALWSPASWSEKGLVIEKFIKLLYLPIFVVGFREKVTRTYALNAFLLAMLLTFVMTFLCWLRWIYPEMEDPSAFFRNHIMTSFMMSFAAYVSLVLASQTKGVRRAVYVSLFTLFSFHIWFINTGRMGYLEYLILMGVFLAFSVSWKKAMVFGFVGMGLIVATVYFSPGLQHRIVNVYDEWHAFHQTENKDTSIGYRIQFHDYAKQLFLEHPLIGNGTASFTARFAKDKPVPSWDRRLLEPHNVYWLIASELGLLGILIFTVTIITLLQTAAKLGDTKLIAFGMLSIFLLGNLTDSLLFYSGTGYIFILMMAIAFGESLQNITRGP